MNTPASFISTAKHELGSLSERCATVWQHLTLEAYPQVRACQYDLPLPENFYLLRVISCSTRERVRFFSLSLSPTSLVFSLFFSPSPILCHSPVSSSLSFQHIGGLRQRGFCLDKAKD